MQATAFLRRDGEPGISVSWLEHPSLPTRREEALVKVIRILRKHRTVKASSCLAVMNVGHARQKVRSATSPAVELAAVHTPRRKDPTHTTMQGMEVQDMFVGELLAEAAREGGVYSVATLVPST